jgi:hypothetical protein
LFQIAGMGVARVPGNPRRILRMPEFSVGG